MLVQAFSSGKIARISVSIQTTRPLRFKNIVRISRFLTHSCVCTQLCTHVCVRVRMRFSVCVLSSKVLLLSCSFMQKFCLLGAPPGLCAGPLFPLPLLRSPSPLLFNSAFFPFNFSFLLLLAHAGASSRAHSAQCDEGFK